MHMHPTATHAADHRRQNYLAEAAANWNWWLEKLTIRRRTQGFRRVTATVGNFLTWLTREFAPFPPSVGLEPHPGRPFSIYGPH